MNENFEVKNQPYGAIALGLSVLIISIVSLGYTYYKFSLPIDNSPTVLGEKSTATDEFINVTTTNVCSNTSILQERLERSNVNIDLYTPETSVNFKISNFASCIAFPLCDSTTAVCEDVIPSVDEVCVEKALENSNINFNKTKTLTSGNTSITIRAEDWVVSTKELAKQLKVRLEKELNYCDLNGEKSIGKSKITSITVPVTDILPSAEKTFATRFMEIDQTKGKMYFWKDGVYQELYLRSGVKVGADKLIQRKNIDLSKFLGGVDYNYVNKNTNPTDWVVVHE